MNIKKIKKYLFKLNNKGEKVMLEELQEIFREVFDNPEMIITEETTADDVDEWTSLVHMQLLSTIEEKYGISFSSKDVRKMKKVGDLLEIIERKTSGQ